MVAVIALHMTSVPQRKERRRRLRGVATGEQIVDHATARRADQRCHGAIAARARIRNAQMGENNEA